MAKQQNNGNITVLGEETCFEGYLEFTDSLVVTGKFEGTIKSEENLRLPKQLNVKLMKCLLQQLWSRVL